MKSRICLAVLVTALTAFGYLRSYEVTPTQASWSGWVSSSGYVGETFIANFDSITEVSLFCGARSDTYRYRLQVLDAQTNELTAHQYYVAPPSDHSWLRFTSIVPDGKFVRGNPGHFPFSLTPRGDSVS